MTEGGSNEQTRNDMSEMVGKNTSEKENKNIIKLIIRVPRPEGGDEKQK